MKAYITILLAIYSVTIHAQTNDTVTYDRPQTVEQVVASVNKSIKGVRLKIREGVSQDDVVFALQHTVGKKFDLTPEKFAIISKYYQQMSSVIAENPNDVKALGLTVKALDNMTFLDDDPALSDAVVGLMKQDKSMKLSINVKHVEETEFSSDKRLKADTDKVDESLSFIIDGKEKIFAKQYLASLLETIAN